MDTIIRTATLADLDAVAAVEAACFPAAEAASKEEFAERIACLLYTSPSPRDTR